jgi:DMSO/TMAO reductase YedYZ molybdopterin-dependent catalytic subunit
VTARGTDWGLAALVASLIATGVLTLFAGTSHDAWVFDVHDALGFAIALLVVVKLRRVWWRLVTPARWHRRAIAGIGATAIVLASLASGWLWSGGLDASVLGYSLLAWHEALGAALAAAVAAHMLARSKPLRGRDLAHRRQFFAAAGIGASSLLAWYFERPVQTLIRWRGAERRFTGSYEAASFAGNGFPTTSWVADDPRPIAPQSYRLRVGGLVARELSLSLTQLSAGDELTATLDCTGGFYSTQRWRGISLRRVLAMAQVSSGAHHVRIVSKTGYRWSFSLQDARGLLLATHVGDDALSHEHGAPLRLVAPGSRGFQWIKWVSQIELLEQADYGAPASTVWSSFTRAGRGDA